MSENAITYERTITAEASAVLPDRPLTAEERAHLGLPPEPEPAQED